MAPPGEEVRLRSTLRQSPRIGDWVAVSVRHAGVFVFGRAPYRAA